MFLRTRARKLEGISQDSVRPPASEGTLLHADFIFCAFVDSPPDLRILTLVVLSNDVKVDLVGLAVSQRGLDAGHQANRPKIHVLSELPADWDQQTPERDVVGDPRKSDSAEENGIMMANPFQAILGHHPLMLGEVLAAPGESLPDQLDSVFSAGCLQHPLPLGYHFLPDSIARDDRDLIAIHGRAS